MKRFLLCMCLIIMPLMSQAGPFNLPRGNYLQTCSNCQMFNGRLSCTCQTRQGFPRYTALYVPPRCNFVQNINGHLRCTHRRRHWRHHRLRFRKKLFRAGPIWNQNDAQFKCPNVCADHHEGQWTGVWRTIAEGQMSLCQCRGWYR